MYLETVQPEWDSLPLAYELIELRRRETIDVLHDSPQISDSPFLNKAKGILRLLRKLNLITDGELTGWGECLADVYNPPTQSSFSGEGIGIGTKTSLSSSEQLLLWTVIYHEHRFPMLAVLHQVAEEQVPEKQAIEPAKRLAKRIDHLYPDVDSVDSWMPRAKVHYKWLLHLGLAKAPSRTYTLTPIGKGVLKHLNHACPSEWDDINSEPETTLSEFTTD